jgi:hypothetical protein
MPGRRLIGVALVVIVTSLATPARAEIAGGQGGAGSDSVSSWVIGQGPGGGVRPPTGVTCGAWDEAANLSPEAGVPDIGTVRQDAAGVIWWLYYRFCGTTIQFVWVPKLPPEDLGKLAFDEVVKKLPKPAPQVSPDLALGGYVNFETWLALADPGLITATSTIPGLSATATARVVRIEWHPGDGSMVTYTPFGELPPSPGYTGKAPCGHVYTLPSVKSATGTSDGSFHGTVVLVWDVSWAATDGSSGDLGEASSTSPFVYRVREIQTVGSGG